MSQINDFTIRMIAEQRQREMRAEAADSRLAAIARNSHPAWWRRLLRNLRHTRPRHADGAVGRRPSAQGHEHAGLRPDQPASLRTEPQMRPLTGSGSRTAVAR
jgi:hypothetical protein